MNNITLLFTSIIFITIIVIKTFLSAKSSKYLNINISGLGRFLILLFIYLNFKNENITIYFIIYLLLIYIPLLYISYKNSIIINNKKTFILDIIIYIAIIIILIFKFNNI